MKRFTIGLFIGLQRIGFELLILLIGLEVYSRFGGSIIRGDKRLLSFLILWLFTAYIMLPRIHRLLTKLYLPEYFIGRVRTGEGILADPVNLAFNGSSRQLSTTFAEAGWTVADPLTPQSIWKMAVCSLLHQSYPNAPVSSYYLFGNRQEIAFQKEVNGNPRARHHVRFWRTPDSWYLPGGMQVDWLGAATYDKSVSLSLFTGQFTHRIAENTDEERDYTWKSLPTRSTRISKFPHFTTPYTSRSHRGDPIRTDGTLIVISHATRDEGSDTRPDRSR